MSAASGPEGVTEIKGKYVVFFPFGFYFTNIHESQDCRGRGKAFH